VFSAWKFVLCHIFIALILTPDAIAFAWFACSLIESGLVAFMRVDDELNVKCVT
jgi:hypothetical protein